MIAAVLAGGVAVAGASAPSSRTSTPIKYLVVIYQENISFDHYFGRYPHALNPPGEPSFHARPGTPAVNGLTDELLVHNPNPTQPFRLSRSHSLTCNPEGGYRQEQERFDHGRMDRFVTTAAGCPSGGIPMAYVDGNTVTALWNYAQRYAMSDNSFQTSFGQSLEGHVNLISGQTYGATPANIGRYVARGSLIGDVDPQFDACSKTSAKKSGLVAMSGMNVGDLLSRAGVTWGWFEGGFAPSAFQDGKPVCASAHRNIGGELIKDYVPHHEPFQYYRSTANPDHLAPESAATVGSMDRANHQYGLSWFWRAAKAGHQPEVSFLKAPHYQDGHPGASDPLDEQRFLVQTINAIERLPTWSETAIVIAYDDPGGWYDHVAPRIVNGSDDATYDTYSGEGRCGAGKPGAYPLRCGHAERLPLLVISPYAKVNYVDHTLTDQTSILRFIEDNWRLGRIGKQSYDVRAGSLLGLFDFSRRKAGKLLLDPSTGEPSATVAR
jgi:phospholipase C